MRKLFVAPLALAAALSLTGCDTLDGDWTDYDGPSWSGSGTPPSRDNRSHEQKLRDEAWWDDYHRAN